MNDEKAGEEWFRQCRLLGQRYSIPLTDPRSAVLPRPWNPDSQRREIDAEPLLDRDEYTCGHLKDGDFSAPSAPPGKLCFLLTPPRHSMPPPQPPLGCKSIGSHSLESTGTFATVPTPHERRKLRRQRFPSRRWARYDDSCQ